MVRVMIRVPGPERSGRMGVMSRLLAFIFLEKSARDRLDKKRNTKKPPVRPAGGKRPAAASRGAGFAPPMTQERAELIAQAMEIRRQKQDVLAELSEEEREKMLSVLLGKNKDESG